jgi:hypothetical protein
MRHEVAVKNFEVRPSPSSIRFQVLACPATTSHPDRFSIQKLGCLGAQTAVDNGAILTMDSSVTSSQQGAATVLDESRFCAPESGDLGIMDDPEPVRLTFWWRTTDSELMLARLP